MRSLSVAPSVFSPIKDNASMHAVRWRYVFRAFSSNIARLLGALALCLSATAAQAAGFRLIEVPTDANGPAMKGAIWYPCTAKPTTFDFGDWVLRGLKDCPITGNRLPLVVISHGNSGSTPAHHDTAEALAEAGFIVAAIDHPGDSITDLSRVADLSVHVERPTDIKRLIDFMLTASPAASRIDANRIGVFGFSAGGYTALVLIGANPDWAMDMCQASSDAATCADILRKEFRPRPLTHDTRIKAAVIADPACCFFTSANLSAITAPVQLWVSERGGKGSPTTNPRINPENESVIDRGLRGKHEYHLVPNAAHFAFLPPCPPPLAKGFPEGCKDAPGFDRAAFHKAFNSSVLAFFRVSLGK
jgi:predicted dienelactone hydrolase